MFFYVIQFHHHTEPLYPIVLYLDVDKFSGNSRNFFIRYYLAQVYTQGLEDSISLRFLLPAHTKTSYEAAFKNLKRCSRETKDPISHLEISFINGIDTTNTIVPSESLFCV